MQLPSIHSELTIAAPTSFAAPGKAAPEPSFAACFPQIAAAGPDTGPMASTSVPGLRVTGDLAPAAGPTDGGGGGVPLRPDNPAAGTGVGWRRSWLGGASWSGGDAPKVAARVPKVESPALIPLLLSALAAPLTLPIEPLPPTTADAAGAAGPAAGSGAAIAPDRPEGPAATPGGRDAAADPLGDGRSREIPGINAIAGAAPQRVQEPPPRAAAESGAPVDLMKKPADVFLASGAAGARMPGEASPATKSGPHGGKTSVRSAKVAELEGDSTSRVSPRTSAKQSEVLIRPTRPFTATSAPGGTGIAEKSPVFRSSQSIPGDVMPSSLAHAAGGDDAARDSFASASFEGHASTAQAMDAVNVAIEVAARDRNSVKLDFEVAGERVAVLVERHADEVRATFKADSPELRAALAHEWQATAAHGAGAGVQTVFVDHSPTGQPAHPQNGYSHPDSSARQRRESPPSGGGAAQRRRDAGVPLASSPAAPPPASRDRHLTSVHLHTTA